MKVIGLMSGTSADGIDAALLDFNGPPVHPAVRLLDYKTYPYPPGLQTRLIRLAQEGHVRDLCHLNFYLGELFAKAALKLIKTNGISPHQVRLIGSHGQTVHHLPTPRREKGCWVRSTLQIGEISVIAERTGITTIGDFRPSDIAAGGEGAPLTPFLHRLLFQGPEKEKLVINIGGICNITYLPAKKNSERKILAFDVGPGNMVMDGLMVRISRGRLKMDRHGTLAGRGKVSEPLFQLLVRHPFLKVRPPKTSGREAFGESFLGSVLRKNRSLRLSNADLLATVTAFTVYCIGRGFQWLPRKGDRIEEMIVGGGGAKNATLMRYLREVFAPIRVRRCEDYGINSNALEAMAFGLFAFSTYQGLSNTIPSVTGAKRAVRMGKIVERSNPID